MAKHVPPLTALGELETVKKLLPMRTAIILTLIACLCGIGYLQYRLGVMGLRLAHLQLDQGMHAVQAALARDLQEPNRLSGLLAAVLTPGQQRFDLGNDSLRQATAFFLEKHIENRLRNQGLDLQTGFALYDAGRRVLASADYPADDAAHTYYVTPLRGYVASTCRCSPVLHLHLEGLTRYLVLSMTDVLAPALILLLLAGASTLWLVIILRRQRRLDEVKNDFINNLTHELKTPVFSISLAARMLGETPNLGPGRSYLDIIRRENEKLKTHVDQVLELASLETGRSLLERAPHDLNAVVAALLPAFEPRVAARAGQLRFIPHDGPCRAAIHPAHFANAVHNLLDNALKYSPETVQIEVRTFCQGRQAGVSVRDQGMGIPRAEQRRIFDKFHKLTQGDLHPVKGFGLGLSYVKQVLRHHQGQVQVTSQPGQGSTFTLLLPALPPAS